MSRTRWSDTPISWLHPMTATVTFQHVRTPILTESYSNSGLVDVQVDSQQCQPPQEDGKNDRQYGLEQPQMQVTPRPCDEYADGEVEQEDNANWSFKHGCAAPIRP